LWADFADVVVLTPWTREVATPRSYRQSIASWPEVEERLLLYGVGRHRRDIAIHQRIHLTPNVHSGLAETNLSKGDEAPPLADSTLKSVFIDPLVEGRLSYIRAGKKLLVSPVDNHVSPYLDEDYLYIYLELW